jgi:hypothetical protein
MDDLHTSASKIKEAIETTPKIIEVILQGWQNISLNHMPLKFDCPST